MTFTPSRRQVLQGAGLTTLWHLAGEPSVAFAAAPPGDVLVSVFLQGGFDGLSLLAPLDHPVYAAARGGNPAAVTKSARLVDQTWSEWLAARNTASPVAALHETTSALPFCEVGPADDRTKLYLHQEALPLKDLIGSPLLPGDLAVVFNAGFREGSGVLDDGSHFLATDRLLHGEPEAATASDGWLGRTIAAVDRRAGGPVSTDVFRAMDHGAGVSLRAPVDPATGETYTKPVATASIKDLAFKKFKVGTREFNTLAAEYDGVSGDVAVTARTTFNAMRAAATLASSATAVAYPPQGVGQALKSVAALVKADRGIQVATVQQGNWDDHGSLQKDFPGRLRALSWALRAFVEDLRSTPRRVTLVVTSEFGRRVAANSNGGTDHGYGNVVLVLGAGQGHAVKGYVHDGTWRSLRTLARNGNLAVATDFRQVLGEVVAKRAAASYDATVAREVFPAYYAERDPAAAFAGVLG